MRPTGRDGKLCSRNLIEIPPEPSLSITECPDSETRRKGISLFRSRPFVTSHFIKFFPLCPSIPFPIEFANTLCIENTPAQLLLPWREAVKIISSDRPSSPLSEERGRVNGRDDVPIGRPTQAEISNKKRRLKFFHRFREDEGGRSKSISLSRPWGSKVPRREMTTKRAEIF